MAFRLLPLLPQDVPHCVSIYFAAFQNAHSLACWPRDVPAVREWWERMLYDELEEPGAWWLKVVLVEEGMEGTGEVVCGFGKWVEPKPGVFPETDLPQWPEGADKALCEETFGAWARRRRELMGDRGHWYLEIVATSPTHQGKGVGSKLMRWGLERADAQGMEAYLEASPEAVPLYEKLGFREADRIDTLIRNERVEGVWYRNLFMIRQPVMQGREAER
ncbi:uncharacterized protein LTR77_008045 [Saxophila tyrrhenica]|uniref:N-acetyltransferase domain-containing protein n=1 Tax=Saxophila tyrrhenica TaxID=1690608 RepID=A0AAV9P244_9PEZI|nr:hypothetical protein LTR77_008045 [Saxophila tyrrhenica]